MKRNRAGLVGLLVAALLLSGAPAAASAATPDDVDPQIAQLLKDNPGGILIDNTHAVWPELGMEASVTRSAGPAARSVGPCATGKICIFTGQLGGLTVSWSICGTIPVPSGFVPRSLVNARSSGYAQARSSSGGVLATAYAGSWVPVGGTATSVHCVF